LTNVTNLASDLAETFERKGYTWRIQTDDGPRYLQPDAEDMQKVLDTAADRLYTEKEPAQLEVGRLVFRKNEGRIEVYPLYGILGEE
jgi:hypothetical protein